MMKISWWALKKWPNSIFLGSAIAALCLPTSCGSDDPTPAATNFVVSISASATSISEGSSTPARFTVSLDNANDTGADITISYSTSGTATAGQDFQAPPTTSVSIANGSSSAEINVNMVNDTDVEGDETITVTLSTTGLGSNVTLNANTSATITITDDDSSGGGNCTSDNSTDTSRSSCNNDAPGANQVTITENTGQGLRIIEGNNLPGHKIGQFPNADVSAQNVRYEVSLNPAKANSVTTLLSNTGPAYAFAVALNGVKIDPVANEPWEFTDNSGEVTYDWNLEALNVRIGLDCNEAHVQPNGAYHYHGSSELYATELGVNGSAMVLMGWAADGYPVYYQYAYQTADNSSSNVVEMNSSYRLRSGERPGNGVSAPCGDYNGRYSQDYEYVDGLGDLDECNGRTGVTPEFPNGTYYYVITSTFPKIPRCLMGTPNSSFRIGGG